MKASGPVPMEHQACAIGVLDVLSQCVHGLVANQESGNWSGIWSGLAVAAVAQCEPYHPLNTGRPVFDT